MVVFHVNVTGGFTEEHTRQIDGALIRVLEAGGLDGGNVRSSVGLWQRVLYAGYSQELSASLQRLAALQGAIWLSADHLQDIQDLFRLLTSAEVSASPPETDHAQCNLLRLLGAWRAPHEETGSLLTAQAAHQVKDVLYTSAAFLQGIHVMEAGDYPAAVPLLQEAAGSLCSSRVLAQIYTCLGCCCQKVGKPQTALQYWKQALQADFRCLSALYHTSELYKQMDKTDAELEVLSLLYKALAGPGQVAPSAETHFLIRTELILNTPGVTCSLRAPSPWEVKYLLASRCLQTGRVEEAVQHYLDLLAVLQDGGHQEGFLPSPTPLPRVPEVFLETAAALLEEKRYQDAITVCDEVTCRTGDLIPGRLLLDRAQSEKNEENQAAEQLDCVLWASAAHLFQGRAQALLRDHTASVTEYTRCINLLLRIQVISSEDATPGPGGRAVTVVETLKASALLGRGLQFLELGRHKEALLNVQLCVQVSPDYPGAACHLLSLLWKLNRKREAVSHCKRFQSSRTSSSEKWEAVKQALPLHILLHAQDRCPTGNPVLKEIQEYSGKRPEEMQAEPDSWR
ncbi:Fanconi anemia group G protein isoform X2 [Ascaphus truei]